MFEKCVVKDKLDNLEKKLDTLVNKDEFESFKKEFTPNTYFNRNEEYSIEYKGNILEDKCKSKEVFEKIQELKKGA